MCQTQRVKTTTPMTAARLMIRPTILRFSSGSAGGFAGGLSGGGTGFESSIKFQFCKNNSHMAKVKQIIRQRKMSGAGRR